VCHQIAGFAEGVARKGAKNAKGMQCTTLLYWLVYDDIIGFAEGVARKGAKNAKGMPVRFVL